MKSYYEIRFLNDFIRMCNDGYQMGWHERNGGNLSYRMTESEVDSMKSLFYEDKNTYYIGADIPNIGGEYFLITGSGKYFRNVSSYPEENIGIIKVSEDGKSYQKVWGLLNGAIPTSETPTHLLNHAVKRQISNSFRVIYHAHTTNAIALTFLLPNDENIYTRLLWEMATECPIVFPKGIGLIEWMVPGSVEIGLKSSDKLKDHDAIIWMHHGTFCAGNSFDEAFGLMETIEKSAEILIKILSTGKDIKHTISTENFMDLAESFGVSLNSNVLEKVTGRD